METSSIVLTVGHFSERSVNANHKPVICISDFKFFSQSKKVSASMSCNSVECFLKSRCHWNKEATSPWSKCNIRADLLYTCTAHFKDLIVVF